MGQLTILKFYINKEINMETFIKLNEQSITTIIIIWKSLIIVSVNRDKWFTFVKITITTIKHKQQAKFIR